MNRELRNVREEYGCVYEELDHWVDMVSYTIVVGMLLVCVACIMVALSIPNRRY